MSKGSKRRPMNIGKKTFDDNWDRIFGNVSKFEMWEHDCHIEGRHMIGKNEECNWCGGTEEEESYKGVKNA